jgi:RNA polymerase sigma-70 factor, ECF subfamily
MSKTIHSRALSSSEGPGATRKPAGSPTHPTLPAQASPDSLLIETLVQQYYSAIRCLALSILQDPGDAEDAAQETFIQAALKLEGFRGESGVKTWLYAIAINECRGRLRKRQVQRRLSGILQALQSLHPSPPSPEEASLQNESGRELWAVVDTLDEAFRLPVLLRYVHDLSVPEIAQALGLPEGTIHSRLHRARLQIQERMGSPKTTQAAGGSEARASKVGRPKTGPQEIE